MKFVISCSYMCDDNQCVPFSVMQAQPRLILDVSVSSRWSWLPFRSVSSTLLDMDNLMGQYHECMHA